MKLAMALSERADLQRRIAELSGRLENNAKVQEGERPAEDPRAELYAERPYLTLTQWSVADVDGDPQQCGLAGSPTKVKTVQNIVFQAKESKTMTAADADIEGLVQELLNEKIIS